MPRAHQMGNLTTIEKILLALLHAAIDVRKIPLFALGPYHSPLFLNLRAWQFCPNCRPYIHLVCMWDTSAWFLYLTKWKLYSLLVLILARRVFCFAQFSSWQERIHRLLYLILSAHLKLAPNHEPVVAIVYHISRAILKMIQSKHSREWHIFYSQLTTITKTYSSGTYSTKLATKRGDFIS